jgi:hypothetical protein
MDDIASASGTKSQETALLPESPSSPPQGDYDDRTVPVLQNRINQKLATADDIGSLQTRKSPETLILLGFPGCIGLLWMGAWRYLYRIYSNQALFKLAVKI